MHISSSYAKILGETNFHTREFPRSGSKAKDGEKKRKKERLNDVNNNGQLRIANATSGGAHKAAWAINPQSDLPPIDKLHLNIFQPEYFPP